MRYIFWDFLLFLKRKQNILCRIFPYLRSLDSTDKSLHYHTICVSFLYADFPDLYLYSRNFSYMAHFVYINYSSSPIPLREQTWFLSIMNDDTTKQRRTLYNAERESVCSQMSLTPLLHSAPFLFWITHPTNLQSAILCFVHNYLVNYSTLD